MLKSYENNIDFEKIETCIVNFASEFENLEKIFDMEEDFILIYYDEYTDTIEFENNINRLFIEKFPNSYFDNLFVKSNEIAFKSDLIKGLVNSITYFNNSFINNKNTMLLAFYGRYPISYFTLDDFYISQNSVNKTLSKVLKSDFDNYLDDDNVYLLISNDAIIEYSMSIINYFYNVDKLNINTFTLSLFVVIYLNNRFNDVNEKIPYSLKEVFEIFNKDQNKINIIDFNIQETIDFSEDDIAEVCAIYSNSNNLTILSMLNLFINNYLNRFTVKTFKRFHLKKLIKRKQKDLI